MRALTIRDLGEEREAALTDEAQVRGLSVTDLALRLIDEGIARARAGRRWAADAREGLAFEGQHLAARGPSLARYRKVGSGR